MAALRMTTPRRLVLRAAVWVLSQLLPAGFRARQQAEWTGDLIALSASGAGGRWRYLFAAAWTLPSLRAHAQHPGVDRPQAIVPMPTISVTALKRVVLVGLGVPVVVWLLSVPLRYYLLDVFAWHHTTIGLAMLSWQMD